MIRKFYVTFGEGSGPSMPCTVEDTNHEFHGKHYMSYVDAGGAVERTLVLDSPDFWELISTKSTPPSNKTEVSFTKKNRYASEIYTSKLIPKDKLEEIENTIEKILNQDVPMEWDIMIIKKDGWTFDKNTASEKFFRKQLMDNDFTIVSVKRISDGIRLSVGDHVKQDHWNCSAEIVSIWLTHPDLLSNHPSQGLTFRLRTGTSEANYEIFNDYPHFLKTGFIPYIG